MVEFVARRARQVKLAKVYPYATVTKRLEGEQLSELGLLKAAGAVAFTDGERAVANARVMRRALSYASSFDALIVQHPEEPELAAGGAMNEGALASRLGLIGIPACAEAMMIERDIRLVELTGARYHVAHVSTAAAIEVLRGAKAKGLRASCDTTPHHLALNELEVEGYRTFAKVSPPLRSEEDRRAVVAGLADGTIDAIASDHCPQDQDSKRLPFAQAAFGVIGLETLLPVSLRLCHEAGMSLLAVLEKLTLGPARLLGLEAGRLARGMPADLVLFDPEAPWKVVEARLRSLSKNTAVRGTADGGQGRSHAGGRPDDLRRRDLIAGSSGAGGGAVPSALSIDAPAVPAQPCRNPPSLGLLLVWRGPRGGEIPRVSTLRQSSRGQYRGGCATVETDGAARRGGPRATDERHRMRARVLMRLD